MSIVIPNPAVSAETARALCDLCPFGALTYEDGKLCVSAACKGCRVCVNQGPRGVIAWREERAPAVDKSLWRGIAVFAQRRGNAIHPVTLELLGKARALASAVGYPVYALCIGSGMAAMAGELLHYGADKAFVYDDPALADFVIGPYANAFCDFIGRVRPSAVLVGATPLGRSLAPRVAARVGSGLTADCTALEMKENTDLVQIRPAFGGNIMAQIVTPHTRPQFCTVRYKIFSAPARAAATGEVVYLPVTDAIRAGRTQVLRVEEKPRETDISEADVIVACGRGFKTRADLAMAEALAALLHAQLACTRPLIEAGWFDPKRQIGLSGRTVKPRLLLALGISGSVQFAAGMKGSEKIVAVNSDRDAAIFDVAHVGLVGDLYEILPRLLAEIRRYGHVQ